MTFRADLDATCARILHRDPMALYRFGDGEMMLTDGIAVGSNTQAARADRWQAPAKLTKLGMDLRTVLHEQGPWAYFAIPCPCCNYAGYRRLLKKIQRSPVLPANLFINANYKPFLRWLAMLQGAAVIHNETASVERMPFRVTARMTVPDDGVSYYEENRGELLGEARRFAENLPPRSIVLISAGPLSEALIFFMWNHCPEHVYVDVGSGLDELSYGRKTRPFMVDGNEYATKQCSLPEMIQPYGRWPNVHPSQETDEEIRSELAKAPVIDPSNARLCLAMIVKNEKEVIARCLRSVRPLLKHWVIVDTGSTDGTQEIVKKELEDIPGTLYERPWVDFATNRNMVIALARGKATHTIMLDADDVLVIDPNFKMPQLTFDSFHIRVMHGELEHWRPHIFRSKMPFNYGGVLHEWMNIPLNSSNSRMQGITMRIVGGGARSQDPDKFLRDAEVLKRALEKEPTHTRYAFYLAQSYRDHYSMTSKPEFLEKAMRVYEQRAGMKGGHIEETYQSLFEVARCQDILGRDPRVAYLAAYEFRPLRAEPLFYLARWLRTHDSQYVLAAIYARHAAALTRPLNEGLWVEHAVYDWWALDEFVVAASWIPALRAECRAACLKLLQIAPREQRERISGILAACSD
jgi:glycosyltransferase involved in cell wall biosynthesis